MSRSRKKGKNAPKERKNRAQVDSSETGGTTQKNTPKSTAQRKVSKNIFDAVASNDEISVKDLIENQRIPLTTLNSEKQTAAHLAAQHGNLNLLKYLLNKDASVLSLVDHFGNNVLFWAVQNGFVNIVEYLIDVYNVNILEQNKRLFGNCAIHVAAENGQLEVLKYLIEEQRGDVDVKNEIGETPIFVATDKTQLHIIKYLVEDKAANVTTTDENDDNVLYLSAKTGELAVPKYLLDERKIQLDINHRNAFGCTVTFMASRFNNLDLVKYFVEEKHADINIADENGKTPVHEVASIGHFEMVKYLVEQGADLTLKDKCCNKTALQTTTDNDILKYLRTMVKKRTSRSVFVESIDKLSQSTPVPQIESDYLDRNALSTFGDMVIFKFDTLLIVANACVQFFTKSRYEQNKPLSVQSSRDILFSKADTLAVDATINFPMT